MVLYVALAIFRGVPGEWLNDPKALRAALNAAVEAGPFSHYETTMVQFTPQGVTGCAIVGESHLAVHSWPEEGRLFLDVASCSTPSSVENAVHAVLGAMPEGEIAVVDYRTVRASPASAAPTSSSASS